MVLAAAAAAYHQVPPGSLMLAHRATRLSEQRCVLLPSYQLQPSLLMLTH